MFNVLKRLWPSPSMVIATLALVFATAGVASSAPFSSDSGADKKLFNNLLANAAPNLSVNHASTATTATNAQKLAGQPASAYKPGNCQVGTIKGSLVIAASALNSVGQNTPSTEGGFNCTGGGVQIRRTALGTFYVFFPGLTNGPVSIASGSCVISALVANTGGQPVSVTCEKAFDSGVFGHDAFLVQTLENGNPADVGFSLLAF